MKCTSFYGWETKICQLETGSYWSWQANSEYSYKFVKSTPIWQFAYDRLWSITSFFGDTQWRACLTWCKNSQKAWNALICNRKLKIPNDKPATVFPIFRQDHSKKLRAEISELSAWIDIWKKVNCIVLCIWYTQKCSM